MNTIAYLMLMTVALFLFNYILYRIALQRIRKQIGRFHLASGGVDSKEFEKKIEAKIAGKLLRQTL